jgi:hypothetical protein
MPRVLRCGWLIGGLMLGLAYLLDLGASPPDPLHTHSRNSPPVKSAWASCAPFVWLARAARSLPFSPRSRSTLLNSKFGVRSSKFRPRYDQLFRLNLSAQQKADLVEFLKSL